ncbi:energy transducer TonB [Novosphingobium huizhouense]|uniref:energy transducer TonB n=1 Tax=Novosphingobium huizhouense TaxID=2866625 RepID=UPI001CD83510|nr:energy transducer TonB [Novosphingobium huizhouense]
MIGKTNKMIGAALVACALFPLPAAAQPAAWIAQVARAIAAKQTYPRTAQMRGEEGTAKVKVFVSAAGAVEKTELVAASGSATLDREALALPARAGTLPPPPGGATAVTVPITWKLL